MHVLANGAMGLRIGVSNPADRLRLGDGLGAKAERRGNGIAGLHLKLREIDGARVEPRRRAGLEPAHFEAQAAQRLTQQHRGRLARASGRILVFSAMDQAVEKSAGGDDDRARLHRPPVEQAHAAHA